MKTSSPCYSSRLPYLSANFFLATISDSTVTGPSLFMKCACSLEGLGGGRRTSLFLLFHHDVVFLAWYIEPGRLRFKEKPQGQKIQKKSTQKYEINYFKQLQSSLDVRWITTLRRSGADKCCCANDMWHDCIRFPVCQQWHADFNLVPLHTSVWKRAHWKHRKQLLLVLKWPVFADLTNWVLDDKKEKSISRTIFWTSSSE